MADLLAAIGTLSTKLIPNSKGEKRIGYALRLNEYSARYLSSVAPQLAKAVSKAEAAEVDVPEAISTLPQVAIHQLLAAVGHPVQFNEAGESMALDPQVVLAAATEEQGRELALLGFFGTPGTYPNVDYSLFETYYQRVGGGSNWEPKDPDTGAWQTYMSTKAD